MSRSCIRLITSCLLAGFTLAQPSLAATYTVNSSIDAPGFHAGVCDTTNGGNICSLRAAVQASNFNAGTDTIRLPWDMTMTLTIPGDGSAVVGDLDITEDLIIDVVGGILPLDTDRLPTIDAATSGGRIFDVPAGITVQIRGLRMVNGLESGTGGAIRNEGQLHLETTVFSNNRAALGGGAIRSMGPGSVLEVYDSHFQGNRVDVASGAAVLVSGGGTARVRRSSFIDNTSVSMAFSASTIQSTDGSELSIESSYLTGDTSHNDYGIYASTPAVLALRNVTVKNFDRNAFRASGVSDSADLDIANSILHGGDDGACRITTSTGHSGTGIRIGYSMISSDDGCSSWYDNVLVDSPHFAGTIQGFESVPGRVSVSLTPSGITSNIVDRGIPLNVIPASPAQACVSTDIFNTTRPDDGDLDGEDRCDLGAVELHHPGSLVLKVNNTLDLADLNPGDGICDASIAVGYQCTLRAAVMEANAHPGLDSIRAVSEGNWPISLDLSASAGAEGGDLDITERVYIDMLGEDNLPMMHVEQTVTGERLFEVNAGAGDTIWLRGLRLSGGSSNPFSGGAIRVASGVVRIHRAEIDNNSAAMDGGAISVINGNGSVVITESDLHHNAAPNRGSAIYIGGGANLSLQRSSVTNSSDSGGGEREAVYVDADGWFSAYTATIAHNNGGIVANSPDSVSLAAVTIANNIGPGLFVDFSDQPNSLSIDYSIFAGNQFDCELVDTGTANTSIHINNWNLIEDGDSCITGNPTNFSGDANLGNLQRPAGQLSRVMLPSNPLPVEGGGVPAAGSESDAIDVAPYWICEGADDQRGVYRYQDIPTIADIDGPCDIGAVEVVPDPSQLLLFKDSFED